MGFGERLKFLSAYSNKWNAEYWTKAAIDFNIKSIAAWYEKVQDWDRKTFYFRSDYPVGYGAKRGDRTTTELYSVSVVLEKMPAGHKLDILILSSYPDVIRRKW